MSRRSQSTGGERLSCLTDQGLQHQSRLVGVIGRASASLQGLGPVGQGLQRRAGYQGLGGKEPRRSPHLCRELIMADLLQHVRQGIRA